MIKRSFLLAVVIMTFCIKTSAQKEAWNWYFGANAGVTFSGGPPVAVSNGAMSTAEGCATISDPNGNLLFYTDGIKVYNKNHIQMPNGFGLLGNSSSTQSGVIVRKPGSSTIFYIFTVDDIGGPDGFRYSEVDLNLQGGLGDVTSVKNVLLWNSTDEKCTAVAHCNGTDVWVLSHDWNSAQFRAYLITPAGVNLTPVLTTVGSVHTGNFANTLGQLKSTPDGKKIGYTTYYASFIEVLNFNNSTGVPSNPMTFTAPNFYGGYGFEFSPDGTKFYAGIINAATIWQFNLCAGDGSQAAVASSSTAVGTGLANVGSLQLGPDAKIYFTRSGTGSLGVINNPNTLGVGCNVVSGAISLGTKLAYYGLPNFITSFFGTALPPFTYTTSCLSTNFTAPPATFTLGGCTTSTFAITSYSWNFGDPSSGAANFSNSANPSHSFTAAGTYTVKLALQLPCGIDTIRQVITTNFPVIAVSASPTNTLSCAIPMITLTGTCTNGMNLNFSWTGNCISPTTGAVISATAPCTYSLVGTEPNSGCTTSTIITLYQDIAVQQASVSPGTANIQCGVPAQTFTGSPAPLSNYTYQWLTPCGPPLAGYICNPGCCGVYTFEVTNTQNGCKSTKTATVTCTAQLPTMTITAQNSNYYVTCVSCVTMQITASIQGGGGIGVNWQNANQTQTLTTSNTYSTCIPGDYIAYAYNLAAPNCSVAQLVTVLQNTVTPAAGFTTSVWGTQNPTLTCYNPCAVLTGTSTALSYSVGWETPGTVPDQTLSVCITTNTTQTTVSTPSVVITDLINGCVKKLAVPVYQNIKPVGLTAKATPSLLTCNVIQSQLQYTPNPLSALHTWTWTSPPPSVTYPQINPLNVYAPGIYTVSATESINGCVSSQTVELGLLISPPATVALATQSIACGSPTVLIHAGVTSTTGNTYFWDGPTGTAITAITSLSPSVNMPGTYTVLITNTITGCFNYNYVEVGMGNLVADFIPTPQEGYSPLTVIFLNTTSPTGASSYWGFGNGKTETSFSTINGATIYNSPGTYTVILISQKGICKDTAMKVVKVDIPSKLEVPNVFTPNDDGINDNFILHTANLTDITVSIFDRWGVSMYEVNTEKGNISWDGKNMGGQPVPSGTYFWIIKATGKDGAAYEEKGFLSLYR